MPFQVMHRQHGLVQGRAQGHCDAGSHQQGPRKTGPLGEGHQVHIGQLATGVGQSLVGQRQHTANVVAAGQLWHHAAICLVHGNLTEQRV